MSHHVPPQPALARITAFSGHPVVVGVTPDPAPVLVATAEALAAALGARLCFAFSDPTRSPVQEWPDGSVRHVPLDPDSDDDWEGAAAEIEARLRPLLRTDDWEFHYLAGRADRALTHLARAVDASTIVVGSRGPGLAEHLRESLRGPLAAHLSQHQHRPVLTVPLGVVDWKESVQL